jgi:dolichol-phosphate mannosyltransferase
MSVLLLFARPRSPLLEPEDSLYAEIPRQMAVAGDWLVPVHNGQPYYQKPPLLYWLILVSYTCFGVHDWAARLIPCSTGLAIILVTFWWGCRACGFRAGLAGAVMLCLSPRFLHQSRMITMDGLLCLWVLCGLAQGFRALQSGRLGWGHWLLSASACGLGLLTKGPVTLILVALPLFAFQNIDRRTARPTAWSWLVYIGTALTLAAPWFVAVAVRDPAFLGEFFWTHHVVMRFLQPLHSEPAWFYFPVLLLGMMPWTLLLPTAFRYCIRCSQSETSDRPPAMGFLLLCSAWCFLFFSAATCKRIGYILPAMPTLALALGCALDKTLIGNDLAGFCACASRKGSLSYWATLFVLGVGIVGAFTASYAGLVKPVGGLAMALPAGTWFGCLILFGSRPSLAGSWLGCATSTFVLLLMAVHLLLPGYYRRFAVRSQTYSLAGTADGPRTRVVCYPHYCDSVSFYLNRHNVRSYGSKDRDLLIADIQDSTDTLVFVKTGRALREMLGALPDSLEFVPRGRSSWVTAGVIRRRDQSFAREDRRDP